MIKDLLLSFINVLYKSVNPPKNGTHHETTG